MGNTFSPSVASFSALPSWRSSVVCRQNVGCVDWNNSCAGWTLVPFAICRSHWLAGYLSTGGRSSCNTPGGINAVNARCCDISFYLLEEGSILQFHGVNGTLNKLLFQKQRHCCTAPLPLRGITLGRSVGCSIRCSVSFAVFKLLIRFPENIHPGPRKVSNNHMQTNNLQNKQDINCFYCILAFVIDLMIPINSVRFGNVSYNFFLFGEDLYLELLKSH